MAGIFRVCGCMLVRRLRSLPIKLEQKHTPPVATSSLAAGSKTRRPVNTDRFWRTNWRTLSNKIKEIRRHKPATPRSNLALHNHWRRHYPRRLLVKLKRFHL
jgi:hypothetical protein